MNLMMSSLVFFYWKAQVASDQSMKSVLLGYCSIHDTLKNY